VQDLAARIVIASSKGRGKFSGLAIDSEINISCKHPIYQLVVKNIETISKYLFFFDCFF